MSRGVTSPKESFLQEAVTLLVRHICREVYFLAWNFLAWDLIAWDLWSHPAPWQSQLNPSSLCFSLTITFCTQSSLLLHTECVSAYPVP